MTDWKKMIGYRSLMDLQADARDQLAASGSRITSLNPGGVLWALLSAWLWVVARLYDLLLAIVPQGFALSATGAWLDEKCREAMLTRKPATYALGTATFYRATTAGSLTIKQGTVWKATNAVGTEVRFVVTADTVVLSGTSSVLVPSRAEFAGASGNLATGTPVQLLTSVPGIDGVRLDAEWLTSHGTDQETDDQLRTRYGLAWSTLSVGSTADKYLAWALQVTGVTSARIDDDHPRGEGTIDIYVLGPDGIPDPALLQSVQNYINLVKLNEDDVLVKSPVEDKVDVTLVITIPVAQGDVAIVQANAIRAVSAIFKGDATTAITPLSIGDGLYRSRLVDVAFMPPVVDVKVLAPVDDIRAVSGQQITLGHLTVTVERE